LSSGVLFCIASTVLEFRLCLLSGRPDDAVELCVHAVLFLDARVTVGRHQQMCIGRGDVAG
jgi:hypothetical protein